MSALGTQATYDDLVRELLHDGGIWKDQQVGLLVAVGAYAPSRREAGRRFAAESRLPWSGAATSLRLDFERDVLRLHRLACEEVFGHDTRMDSVAATINHLGLLIEKVSEALALDVLKQFKAYRRRALVILEEERPARRVPEMTCPYCWDEGLDHAIMLEPDDAYLHGVRRIYCSGCGLEWSLETSGLLARVGSVVA